MAEENTYFQERMDKYGITDELNRVKLWKFDADLNENVLADFFIFEPDDKGIAIYPYTIERSRIRHGKPAEIDEKGHISKPREWKKPYCIIRLEKPEKDAKTGKEKKYHIPKGAGTPPFFPPNLLEYYEKKEKRKTLIITEGYFKAFAGYMVGLDIIGLVSITTYRDKDTKTLHPDIIKLIHACQYENIILLYDGDCRNISLTALHEEKDLYTRPSGFFKSAKAIRDLLKDVTTNDAAGTQADIYFSHPLTDEIEGNPKGLDDLLLARPEEREAVVSDLHSFGRPGRYFYKDNITHGLSRLQKHLHIDGSLSFYEHHQTHIGEKTFIYYGTKYKWSEEKRELEMVIPGAAKHYFRVGDQYYERLQIPNKYGQIENIYHRRQKETIKDDHGQKFIKHVPKYKAFCIVPSHDNYQEVIHNCYNVYAPFEHQPEDGSMENSLDFIKHIFGDEIVRWTEDGEKRSAPRWELGLDYLQLLYQKPTQVLPILCLVSKENGTGKSTFAKWLKAIFTQNMVVVGNADLQNDFNASYASRLLICCDEAFIDKKTVIEKIKSLSTGDKIMVNAKGKDQVEMDFFGKFLLLTNNEENFVHATEDDIRYWVLKVPQPKQERRVLPELIEEIPAFLHFLSQRKMVTKDVGSRMHFVREHLITEALKKVIVANQTTVEKELRNRLRDMFLDFGVAEITMTVTDIWQDFFNRKYEKNYIEKVVTQLMKVDAQRNGDGKIVLKRYRYPRWEKQIDNKTGHMEHAMVMVNGIGRPLVFKREVFLTQDEIINTVVDPEMANELKILMPEGVEINKSQQDELPF